MKKLQILARASLLISIFALHSFAGDQYLVRVTPTAIDRLAKQHRVKVNRQLADEGVYLVTVPNAATLEALKADATVQAIAANSTVTLPELSGYANQGKRRIPHMTGGPVTVAMPGSPFSAYTNQKPNSIIRLQQAQKRVGYGNGGLTVGVIDTWIDTKHSVLQGKVSDNIDFVLGASGSVMTNQETTPFVDQETTPFVDGLGSVVVLQQETTPFVDQETTPFVDQETTPFVDQETTPFVDGIAWGHGTGVAGIIHLVAPNVTIVPLRAFRGSGKGELADVIEAINWAKNNGIKVLNMSFSTTDPDPEGLEGVLGAAIASAEEAGVICIASVSNKNSGQSVYPASFAGVIGVAATDQNNQRAVFSNYGPEVDIAAPGLDIWTTYPNKKGHPEINTRYAAVSGTSFSNAYVSGTVALLRSGDPGITAAEATQAIKDGAGKIKKSPELNADELDVFKTVK